MAVTPIAVSPSLAVVLNSAGDKSNVDFDYLLQTAMRESSLNPEAKASSSSAVGLFQFLESTWLQVMKEEGPRLGYGKYADAITRTPDGDYTIKNKTKRAEILALREDPQMAADLAAAFTQSNGAYLKDKFGRMPSAGELYIAHFLGPQGAEKLFTAGLENPDQVAANLFPRQAKANRQIFYSGDHARTIREVYRALVAKHENTGAADASFVTQQLAAAPEVVPSVDPLEGRFRWPVDASASAQDASGFATLYMDPVAPQLVPPPSSAMQAVDALAGTSAAAPEDQMLGYVPLPAPLPLTAPQDEVSIPHLIPAPAADATPRARVLMTNRPAAADGNAFLAQIYGN
ncbi:MAG: transglycosylase SLT domain-containing protein [Devosia sp.]